MAETLPKFASALSTEDSTDQALAEVLREALEQLSAPVDLAYIFVTSHHQDHLDAIAKESCRLLGTECVIGCMAESVLCNDQEAEETPAISLWLASLPGTSVVPMHLKFERTPDGGTITGWSEQLPKQWPEHASTFVVSEPFSFPADLLLERINEDFPGTSVVGGIASASYEPGENRIILGPNVLKEGAVFVYLEGKVRVRPVVSQGCRPIGKPMVITQSERNVIHQLGGFPALNRVEEIYKTLPVTDQKLVQRGLHIGRVVSEYQSDRTQGDFIIRNVVGIDKDSGALMIGDYAKTGQTVQFQIRDEFSASAELKQMFAEAKNQSSQPLAALTFSCNGRGSKLFSQPHHDANCLKQCFGEIPNAGFFAAGEIGPVAGQNFLHGFTACVALFEQIEQDG